MTKIWCEWDIGQDALIFSSEVTARKWLNSLNLKEELCMEEGETLEDLIADGFISFSTLTLVE